MRYLKKNRIDFYTVYNRKPEPGEAVLARRRKIIPIVVIVIAFALFWGYLEYGIYILKQDIGSLKGYLADPGVAGQFAKQEDLINDISVKSNLSGELDQALSALKTVPTVDKDFFDNIGALVGNSISIMGISYFEASGIMTFNVVAQNVQSVPEFVQRLENSGIFAAVSYLGYGQVSENIYGFEVDCLLLPGESEVQ